MTLSDLKTDEDEIKRYLFAEMESGEADRFEERLFNSDELFFEVSDLENRIVDDFVSDRLSGSERRRFNSSLERVPERRQKVANARAIAAFIDEARVIPAVEAPAEKDSFWRRIFGGGGTPAFAYAVSAFAVVMMFVTGILLVQNRRNSSDLARLEIEQQRQAELERERDSLRQRETELQTAIDSEREASGDLNEELQAERSRREGVEQELNRLKRTPASEVTTRSSIIATLILSPSITGRGGDVGSVKTLTIATDTKRISFQMVLPEQVKQDERFSVNLNDRPVARNLSSRASAGGRRSIQLTVKPSDLLDGRNSIDVVDLSGNGVSAYGFEVKKK